MDHRQIQQQDLSQKLSLLESINYQDDASRSNADQRTTTSSQYIRLLDIIALCIATGQPGDVVSAALKKADKGNSQIIYLSKNGEPTPKDINYAQTFLSALQASKNQSMLDILPTIASRSVALVQRRVDKLQSLVNKDKTFRDFLNKSIDKYTPIRQSLILEFPSHDSTEYLKSEGYDIQRTDSSMAKAVLIGILRKFDIGLTFNAQTSSHLKLQSLVFAATTFRESMFLRSLTERHLLSEEMSKLCRNVNKVCQYIRVIDLIQYIQENGPFKIEWVYKVNIDSTLCYEYKGLQLRNALTIASGVASRLKLRSLTSEELTQCFQRKNPFHRSAERKNPSAKRHVDTYVHAELKLIVFLLNRSPQRSRDQEIEHRPIGCSKRSCLYCTFWIEELQGLLNPTVHRFIYYTAGGHGSPYATCAQVGPFKQDPNGLCSIQVQNRINNLADQQVKELFNAKRGHIKNNHSEDYASASDSDQIKMTRRLMQLDGQSSIKK